MRDLFGRRARRLDGRWEEHDRESQAREWNRTGDEWSDGPRFSAPLFPEYELLYHDKRPDRCKWHIYILPSKGELDSIWMKAAFCRAPQWEKALTCWCAVFCWKLHEKTGRGVTSAAIGLSCSLSNPHHLLLHVQCISSSLTSKLRKAKKQFQFGSFVYFTVYSPLYCSVLFGSGPRPGCRGRLSLLLNEPKCDWLECKIWPRHRSNRQRTLTFLHLAPFRANWTCGR